MKSPASKSFCVTWLARLPALLSSLLESLGSLALALVLALFAQTDQLDVADWQSLREADQPPYTDEEIPEQAPEPPPQWPHLPPAGVVPQVPPEETEYRDHV